VKNLATLTRDELPFVLNIKYDLNDECGVNAVTGVEVLVDKKVLKVA
jgi:hypothetical protein